MRIGFWLPNYLPDLGGLQWSTYRVARVLSRLGVDCRFYVRGNLGAHDTDAEFEVRRFDGSAAEFVARSAQAIAAAGDLDVVHALDLFNDRPLRQLALLASLPRRGIPTVVRIPTLGRARERLTSTARRRAAGRASVFVVLNGEARRELEEMGVASERVHHFGNGVDLDEFRPADPVERRALRARLGLPLDGPIVTYVGRNDRRKRLDVLLAAARALPHPTLTLLVVGVGIAHPSATVDFDRLPADLAPRVRVVPRTEQAALYHRVSDVFVLLSEREGQPNALIEAMASGVPVVATAIPGVTECVEDGREGLLVPVGDAAATAAAIRRLLDDPGLRTLMGRRARRRAVAEHDIARLGQRYAALYEDLVARARHRLPGAPAALGAPLGTPFAGAGGGRGELAPSPSLMGEMEE